MYKQKIFDEIFQLCKNSFDKFYNTRNTQSNLNKIKVEISDTIIGPYVENDKIYNFFLKIDKENNSGKYIHNMDLYIEVLKGANVIGKSYSNLHIMRNKKINILLRN